MRQSAYSSVTLTVTLTLTFDFMNWKLAHQLVVS